MTKFWTLKRFIILCLLIVVGFFAGALLVRAFLNLMVGGSLFGGNLL